MSHNIAGIDIHKKLLVVVIVDASEPDVPLQSRRFGTGAAELSHLLGWLMHYEVREAVMESTAQYWKPVWMQLEPHLRLHLAQAQSNRAPKGRKSDLADVKRLIRRFAAGELMLSFIPEPEQRAWRMITRGRLQLVRARVQLQNQIESLLEEGRIKLSAVISDLLGASGRRILRALSAGESDPEALAELGDRNLKCGRPALVDALTGSMGAIHCQLLAQHLDRVELIDRQIEQLNQLAAAQMQIYQQAVTRLIEVPGIGAEAAQEILAEIGPQAAAFPSAEQLASWIGVCPGSQQSAGENHSGRFAKGNRFLRRLLCQAAQAAARTKGSHLESLFKRMVVRLGYVKAVWAIAHRLCRIVWNILHKGDRFVEFSEARNPKAIQRAIRHHLKALRRLGYQIPPSPDPLAAANG
ncbi:MAG: IS110 family transposase [Bryobacteraceae bacterium]